MRCGARSFHACTLVLGVTLIAPLGAPSPREILRLADQFRGFGRPYRFVAAVVSRPLADGRDSKYRARGGTTVVEVRSDGFAKQLVLVREPKRGDALLKVGDQVWLRPRQLHRLTRIPPELRVFGGAALSDVVAVDLASTYEPTVREGSCDTTADFVLELATTAPHVRYPRAEYRLDCRTYEPRQIDFMTEGRRVLKTVRYDKFEQVLGARVGTEVTVEDHIFGDASSVRMSEFAFLDATEPDYTPGYLLSIETELD